MSADGRRRCRPVLAAQTRRTGRSVSSDDVLRCMCASLRPPGAAAPPRRLSHHIAPSVDRWLDEYLIPITRLARALKLSFHDRAQVPALRAYPNTLDGWGVGGGPPTRP